MKWFEHREAKIYVNVFNFCPCLELLFNSIQIICNKLSLHELLSRTTYDRYAIAGLTKLPGRLSESVVGHLPKEIARITYYFMLRGARMSAKVVDTQHRRSPLVQGLEIPIEVTVTVECTDKCQKVRVFGQRKLHGANRRKI